MSWKKIGVKFCKSDPTPIMLCERKTKQNTNWRFVQDTSPLYQYFSTAGPRPGTRPWHQLYRATNGSPGICHFRFL